MAYASPIPQLGLGTSGRTGEEGMAAILEAIELGYRHIDTAQNYGSEGPAGEAMRRSGLPRSEIFITTKVGDARLDRARFMPSVERSLETLGVDQVDLLLIHWPSERDAVPFEEYMVELKRAQDNGYARLIGVSNYTIAHLERSEALLGPGALATNQVEIHPYLQVPKLRDYARDHGLALTAYQPLARGEVANDPEMAAIAERHDVTAAAIALAFLMAEGHAVIPASSRGANLRANLEARDVLLTDDEISGLRRLDRGHRRINPSKSPRWDD